MHFSKKGERTNEQLVYNREGIQEEEEFVLPTTTYTRTTGEGSREEPTVFQ